jgi:hypothetical protein
MAGLLVACLRAEPPPRSSREAAIPREHPVECDVVGHECEPCWRRRAEAIGAARARWRAEGRLRVAPSGELSFDGRALTGDGHDELATAMRSELLRRGIAPDMSRRVVRGRVRLAGGEATVVHEERQLVTA